MFGFGKKDAKEMTSSILLIISSLEKDLVVELGLDKLSDDNDDKGKEILDQAIEIFCKKIILRGVEKLDQKSIDEFKNLPVEEEIPFLCSKISRFDKIVQEESASFKKETTATVQMIRQTVAS